MKPLLFFAGVIAVLLFAPKESNGQITRPSMNLNFSTGHANAPSVMKSSNGEFTITGDSLTAIISLFNELERRDRDRIKTERLLYKEIARLRKLLVDFANDITWINNQSKADLKKLLNK